MQTQLSLQKMSDLDLILQYKECNNVKAPEILLNRYKGIIYSYALNTFRVVKSDFSVEIDDLVIDYKEQCLLAFQKINEEKIKNKNNFNTIGIILNRFNAYYPVIKKRYSQFCTRDYFEKYGQESHSQNNYNGPESLQFHKNHKNMKLYDKNMDYSIDIYEFKSTLKNDIEKKCFILLQSGFKGFEIAEKLKVSNSTICHIKKEIKKKFKEFMYLK